MLPLAQITAGRRILLRIVCRGRRGMAGAAVPANEHGSFKHSLSLFAGWGVVHGPFMLTSITIVSAAGGALVYVTKLKSEQEKATALLKAEQEKATALLKAEQEKAAKEVEKATAQLKAEQEKAAKEVEKVTAQLTASFERRLFDLMHHSDYSSVQPDEKRA
jgi:biopolymer transport protein ExbB/TolQ